MTLKSLRNQGIDEHRAPHVQPHLGCCVSSKNQVSFRNINMTGANLLMPAMVSLIDSEDISNRTHDRLLYKALYLINYTKNSSCSLSS